MSPEVATKCMSTILPSFVMATLLQVFPACSRLTPKEEAEFGDIKTVFSPQGRQDSNRVMSDGMSCQSS
jgi:hypothetical protein